MITLTLSGTTLTEGTPAPDSVSAAVTIGAASIEDIVVTVEEVFAEDAEPQLVITGGSIMIPAGETASMDTAYIKALDDVVVDAGAGFVKATSSGAVDTDSTQITINDDDSAPTAPRSLTVTAGDTQLTLEWISPLNAGSSEITHYEYRISAAGETLADSDEFVEIDGGAGARSVVISDLTNDSAYSVEVRAVSAAGDGAAESGSGTPTG